MFANVLYLIALTALVPMIAYRMVRHGRYRRGWKEKLLGLSANHARRLTDGKPCVWIHAVSVGEVNLLPRLIAHWQRQSPATRFVISTSTDTGYDLAVQHFGADRVFFCPLDFTWAVRRTFKHLTPQTLVLTELELWPNLIHRAAKQDCRVCVINGRLSERSARRYQRFGKWTRPIFASLHWVGCQDAETRDRFAQCGTPKHRLHVTGSLKFDNADATEDSTEVQACAQWAGVDPWHRVWIVGSTQPGEEAMAINIYQSLRRSHPELRLILVPRHRERFDEVARLISDRGLRVHRRSRDKSLYHDTWDGETIVLIDTIGELRDWWGVASIATVGGSFGDRGGQNMLEPAGYGCAVSFGPDTRNFDAIARRLLDAGGAVRVHNEAELQRFVERCLDDPPAADALGNAARSVVKQHRGATQRTIQALSESLPSAA